MPARRHAGATPGTGLERQSRGSRRRASKHSRRSRVISRWPLAAEVYAMHAPAGYAVIEDLGDNLYAHVIAQGANEIELYEAAARVLAHVHRRRRPRACRASTARRGRCSTTITSRSK